MQLGAVVAGGAPLLAAWRLPASGAAPRHSGPGVASKAKGSGFAGRALGLAASRGRWRLASLEAWRATSSGSSCEKPSGPARSWTVDVSQAAADAWAVLQPCVVVCAAFVLGLTLSLRAALAEENLEVATVDAAWSFIKRNYYDQTFNNQDWEAVRQRYLGRARRGERAAGLTREMVASLGDRYSRAVDAEQFERLMAYDPLGVGVVLTRREGKEVFVSSPPFKGSAAARAGIHQGDVVLAVDGISLGKGSLFSVMDQVAQKDSPQVLLSLRRGPADAPQAAWEETLQRTRVSRQEDQVEAGVAPGADADGHRVGYLRLRSFGARSALELADAVRKVRKDGADELVLDLRENSGGSFQVALEAAALFLEPGSVATRVQTANSAGGRPVEVGTPGEPPVAREPLVVLVDQGSASASEVLSAALRGNCRAPLLGTRTFGKAAVQGVFGLPNREALVLTVAKYSGPSGEVIAGGIAPDGPGPANGLARFASSLGVQADLTPREYGSIDVGAAWSRLQGTCRAREPPPTSPQ